jgi:hypothetical protein
MRASLHFVPESQNRAWEQLRASLRRKEIFSST